MDKISRAAAIGFIHDCVSEDIMENKKTSLSAQKFQLFRHARIYTLNPSLPFANWLLTLGEKIVAVGEPGSQIPVYSALQEVIDLPGECVMPGFIDAHAHLRRNLFPFACTLPDRQGEKMLQSEEMVWINLHDVSTQQLLPLLREKAAVLPAGAWIVGGGWERTKFEPLPTRWQLDEATPHHPVFLSDFTLHVALANSQALRLANIGEDTWNPRGGHIEKDKASGRPTGRLYENATHLVEKLVPPLAQKVQEELLLRMMAHLNSLGIVGVHDMDSSADYDAFPLLAQLLLRQPERFTLRCWSTLKYNSLAAALKCGIWPGIGNDYLRVGALKLIHDGSLGAGTALMSHPYVNTGGEYVPYWGQEVMPRGELQHIAREACQRGISLAIHAIGDRATQNVAEIFEELGYSPQHRLLRHRIEHVQAALPQTIERLAKCGLVFSLQPIHLTFDMPRTAKVQPRLLKHTHAYRKLWQATQQFSTQIAMGTDFPVAPANPLWNIYTAVTRCSPEGQVLHYSLDNAEDHLTIAEAAHAYTMGSAFAAGEEASKGSLEVGKTADFIALSQDIFQGGVKKILDTKVVATYVGARQVFAERAF
jgi:predicted amidohydrolase YtcJ